MSKHLKLFSILLILVIVTVSSENCHAQDSTKKYLSDALALQNIFAEMVERAKPAVVQITTEKITTYNLRYWNPFEDFFSSPFDNFSKRRYYQERPQRQYKHKQQGLGSGFMFRKDGYILTNNHVIKDVDNIKVRLSGETKEYKAEVVGKDSKTDIAIIRIKTDRELPFIKLGNSEKIKVAEWAIAVGNPFGLDQTVTVGVISAKSRHGFGITQYEDFIQTDASINPGNSGGPLLNIKGEVIGINTFILAPALSQGIGFAIPINMAKDIVDDLIDKGKVTRGWLGITIQPITEEIMRVFNLPSQKGVLISDFITDSSPAKKAGVEQGDVIVRFNDRKIEEIGALQSIVMRAQIDKKANITVIRKGKEKNFQVTIKEMPDEIGETTSVYQSEKSWIGLEAQNISEDVARRFGLDNNQGVIAINVLPGSAAEESGIQKGDIIKEVDSRKILKLSDYNAAIESLKGKNSAVFLIRRGRYSRYIIIRR